MQVGVMEIRARVRLERVNVWLAVGGADLRQSVEGLGAGDGRALLG